MPVTFVRAFSSLADVGPSYDHLFGGFFQSRTWFELMAAHGLQDELRIYGVETDRGPAALLLARVRSRRLASLTNTQSFRTSLLVARSPQFALTALARALKRQQPRPLAYDLELLIEPWADRIAAAFIDAGLVAFTRFQDWNRYDDFAAGRPSRFESTRRRQKKLGSAARVEIVSSPADVERLFPVYEQLLAASWKRREAHPDLVSALARAAALQGSLRFGLLTIDGRPAAAEMFILSEGVAYSFKSAYDEALRGHSPGSILLMHLIDDALARVREIDFGPGDEPYKALWLSKVRRVVRLSAYDPFAAFSWRSRR